MTLQSYHDNKPIDPDDDNHPDGLLWPVAEEELPDLPQGTVLEDLMTGGNWVVDELGAPPFVGWGIRGRREEEMA